MAPDRRGGIFGHGGGHIFLPPGGTNPWKKFKVCQCQLISFRENSGSSHISWENLSFPLGFPLSRPIDNGFAQQTIENDPFIVYGSPLKLAPWGQTPFIDIEWVALKKPTKLIVTKNLLGYKMVGHNLNLDAPKSNSISQNPNFHH